MLYAYRVNVEADSQEHADQVMGERLGYDEELEDHEGNAFDYSVWVSQVLGQSVDQTERPR